MTDLGYAVGVVRERLLEQRGVLEQSRRAATPLVDLTAKLDSALMRIEEGGFGICDACDEPMSVARLLEDPLNTSCLECLSAEQQRELERDLDLTARIQRELLPRPTPRLAGFETAFRYQPARNASGDCLDIIAGADGFHFLIGDVAGKGLAAAMLMSHLTATVRSLITMDLPLREIAARANRLFFATTGDSRYATLAFGMARRDGRIDLVNAGHCPPLRVSPGRVEAVGATGPPVGLFSEAHFESTTVDLAPGESLLLHTDGLVEARDEQDFEYGDERLRSWLARDGQGGATALADRCLDDWRAHRGASPQGDDLALLVLTRAR